MKFWNFIKSLIWAAIAAFVVFYIGQALTGWYVDSLKQTGGFITADTLLGAKIAPYAFAVLTDGAILLYSNKNGE